MCIFIFCQAVELQKLILAHNNIESLKQELRNLSQLTVLNVSHNKLSELPAAIGEWVIWNSVSVLTDLWLMCACKLDVYILFACFCLLVWQAFLAKVLRCVFQLNTTITWGYWFSSFSCQVCFHIYLQELLNYFDLKWSFFFFFFLLEINELETTLVYN